MSPQNNIPTVKLIYLVHNKIKFYLTSREVIVSNTQVQRQSCDPSSQLHWLVHDSISDQFTCELVMICTHHKHKVAALQWFTEKEAAPCGVEWVQTTNTVAFAVCCRVPIFWDVIFFYFIFVTLQATIIGAQKKIQPNGIVNRKSPSHTTQTKNIS